MVTDIELNSTQKELLKDYFYNHNDQYQQLEKAIGLSEHDLIGILTSRRVFSLTEAENLYFFINCPPGFSFLTSIYNNGHSDKKKTTPDDYIDLDKMYEDAVQALDGILGNLSESDSLTASEKTYKEICNSLSVYAGISVDSLATKGKSWLSNYISLTGKLNEEFSNKTPSEKSEILDILDQMIMKYYVH